MTIHEDTSIFASKVLSFTSYNLSHFRIRYKNTYSSKVGLAYVLKIEFDMQFAIFHFCFLITGNMVSMLPLIPNNVSSICEVLLDHPAPDIARYYYFQDNTNEYKLKPAAYFSNANCSTLHKGFLSEASPEEEAFPIAFSLMTYCDAEQVYRLLRAIYRPSNLYCIHVDKKVMIEILQLYVELKIFSLY